MSEANSGNPQQTFSMSGDSTSGDITIPSVFMLYEDGVRLRELVNSSYVEDVVVLLTWIRKEGEETEEESRGGTRKEEEVVEGRGRGESQISQADRTQTTEKQSHDDPSD